MGADERSFDHSFRAPELAPAVAGKGLYPPRGSDIRSKNPRLVRPDRRKRARKLLSAFCHTDEGGVKMPYVLILTKKLANQNLFEAFLSRLKFGPRPAAPVASAP